MHDVSELFLVAKADAGRSAETIREYRRIVRRFMADHKDIPLDPEAISKWVGSIEGAPRTRFNHFRVVRTFYGWLERTRRIEWNPFVAVDAPAVPAERPYYLQQHELEQLLTFPDHDQRTAALLFLLAETGLRIGEAARLDRNSMKGGWAAHDADGRQHWRSSVFVRGKTGAREVPVSKGLYDALVELPRHPIYKDWLWWGRKGQLTANTMADLVRQAFRAAGFKGRLYSAHRLRHTVGTLWAGDLFTLQELLGHSTPATTRMYRHDMVAKLREAHPTANPVAQLGLRAGRML